MDILANYIGCLHSELECSHIITLGMQNVLNRLTRRLNEKEKRMILPGYAFIYVEKESNIMRWTDSRSWTPSRSLGPFMVYIEKKAENPLIKKIYSAVYQELNVHLVIYNLLNHEETELCCQIYKYLKKKFFLDTYATMSRCYLKRRKRTDGIINKFNISTTDNNQRSLSKTENNRSQENTLMKSDEEKADQYNDISDIMYKYMEEITDESDEK